MKNFSRKSLRSIFLSFVCSASCLTILPNKGFANQTRASHTFPDFNQVADSIMPSVVAIQSETKDGTNPILGSGFMMSADGHIVTHTDVIQNAQKITARFLNVHGTLDETEHYAQVIGRDPESGVALLKIQAENLPFLSFGNSDKLKHEEWVAGIQAPWNGNCASVIVNTIDVTSNTLTSQMVYEQATASAESYNRGGPLFNSKGKVIGMNALGANTLIPSNVIQHIAKTLLI